ncbi:MAG: PAS domain-containing protein [Prolixibacteraceae bacterium]|nr:PAS domain-containing protein [Prolixibacteraceae bacterium]
MFSKDGFSKHKIEASLWADEMDIMVTVCDIDGTIVYMNNAAADGFHKYGGNKLIGKSLLDCHNPDSVKKIREMLQNPVSNTYTIEKNGEKKMIHQFPWMEGSIHKGIIEFSFKIPYNIENKVR